MDGKERVKHEHRGAAHEKDIGKIEHGPMEIAEREEQEVTDRRDAGALTVATTVQTDPVVKIAQRASENQGQCDREPQAPCGREREEPHRNADDGGQT